MPPRLLVVDSTLYRSFEIAASAFTNDDQLGVALLLSLWLSLNLSTIIVILSNNTKQPTNNNNIIIIMNDTTELILPEGPSAMNIATISAGFEKGDFLVREEQGNRVYFDFFEEVC